MLLRFTLASYFYCSNLPQGRTHHSYIKLSKNVDRTVEHIDLRKTGLTQHHFLLDVKMFQKIPPGREGGRSCGKVMFSKVSVCPQVGGGVHPLGRHPLGRPPFPHETATAADSTHPTGMYSFRYY